MSTVMRDSASAEEEGILGIQFNFVHFLLYPTIMNLWVHENGLFMREQPAQSVSPSEMLIISLTRHTWSRASSGWLCICFSCSGAPSDLASPLSPQRPPPFFLPSGIRFACPRTSHLWNHAVCAVGWVFLHSAESIVAPYFYCSVLFHCTDDHGLLYILLLMETWGYCE